MSIFKGSGVAIITPFNENGIDFEKFKYLIEWHIKESTDAIIVCGTTGEATTMTLVPQVVNAVNIPVIGAGGVGDGRGAAAIFMLGAEAIQVGTRFAVSKESNAHQNFKDKTTII